MHDHSPVCLDLVEQLRAQSAQYRRIESFCHQRYADLPLVINGGTARDLLLGAYPKDIDLLLGCADCPDEIAQTLEEGCGGIATWRDFPGVRFVRWHPDANYQFKRSTWASSCDHVDISLPSAEGETVEDKLAQGDFTINCIGIDTRSGEIIDPLGGYADLQKRILRAGGGDWQHAGGVPRALRALRFISAWDLAIEPQTEELLIQCLANILDDEMLALDSLLQNSLSRVRPEHPGFGRVEALLNDSRVDTQVRKQIQRGITRAWGSEFPGSMSPRDSRTPGPSI